MKRLLILSLLLACSLAASGQVLKGVVKNGTHDKPAAGDDVILLKLGQGMEEEARTKTNAKGEFSFKLPAGNAPHLVRVRHQNVNYHEPAMPGATTLAITVYDAAPKVPEIKLLDQSQVYEAKGNELQVVEVFRLSNTSNPPMTQPGFDFYLPDGATVQLGQAVSSNGMPIKSAPVPQQEKNRYSFLYPVRPGTTQFEVVYTMTYVGTIKVDAKLDAKPDKFFVLTPKEMKFNPDSGLAFHADTWAVEPGMKGVEINALDSPDPGKQIAFTISGLGTIPQDSGQQAASGPAAGGRPEDNRPGGGIGIPNEKPDPLHSGQWAFLAVLALFLSGGAAFTLMNRPVATVAAAPAPKRTVTLLDALKEEIFQIETDRLQGKLSQEEYDSAKSALDKTLHRAIQRQGKG